ncbi:MAG: tetratricopeptide repeat-containing sensor histidine kinase [Bacteroidales bacterium]|jgi:signal transduction histidine kinase|nr:tetratricopeptide repeat-containing sensor histidine kinase [Bacteroidales bacterium]MDI9576074.1 tetratricopeptide repeat-containing sensor histidine kinase [Bacteroidota bacterium]MDD3754954.1 tetratricopeptide repeat-containing sensor histidine kinase [Bacteroidales bacterium]MDY0400304.1 tetratricopeptide repeat-containing sensor histidine kinase [Bacteroidales bacterium]HHW58763.1 sensor histidine kinase [Bacteroidales bacterium]
MKNFLKIFLCVILCILCIPRLNSKNTYDIDKEFIDIITKRSLDDITDNLKNIKDTIKIFNILDTLENQALYKNDLNLRAKIEFTRGCLHYLGSNHIQSLKHFSTSYRIFTSLHDTVGIVYSLYYQSVIAFNINLNSIIVSNFFEAKDYLPGFKNDSLLIEFYRLLGSAYFNMGFYKESIDAVQSAIQLSYHINSKEQLLRSYMNLALNFIELKKYKEAEEILLYVLEKAQESNNYNLIGTAYSYIGYLYNEFGEYEKGIEYNKKALEFRKKINDKRGISTELNNIADGYYKLGNYTMSIEFSKEALKYADSANLTNAKISANFILAQSYACLGNYKGAFDALLKSYTAYKEKYNQNFIQEVLDILVKTSYDYLINENMALKQKLEINAKLIKNNRNLQFFMVLIIIITIIIAYFLFRNTMKNRRLVKEMAKINLELIETNKKLIENEEALKIANATKDKFLSIIAHDIRNPIASMISFIRIMRRDFNDLTKEERNALIDELEKVVNNTNQLLDNLLLWVRSQSGKIEVKIVDTNLNNIISHVQDLFTSIAKNKNIDLIIEGDTNIDIKTDVDMLNTILRNLVNNAIKFTHPQGTVTISTEISNGNLIISVSDTGIGMSEELQEKLFKIGEKVVQNGTNKETGSGLGLLLVKEFVTLLNGKLELESEKGKGTTFRIYLPLDF